MFDITIGLEWNIMIKQLILCFFSIFFSRSPVPNNIGCTAKHRINWFVSHSHITQAISPLYRNFIYFLESALWSWNRPKTKKKLQAPYKFRKGFVDCEATRETQNTRWKKEKKKTTTTFKSINHNFSWKFDWEYVSTHSSEGHGNWCLWMLTRCVLSFRAMPFSTHCLFLLLHLSPLPEKRKSGT